ncbi:hypothetical protein BH23CHL2_BH23CHL2_13310 [soil metagenome]
MKYPEFGYLVAIIRGSQVSVERDARFTSSSGREPIRAAVLCVVIGVSVVEHISCVNSGLQYRL